MSEKLRCGGEWTALRELAMKWRAKVKPLHRLGESNQILAAWVDECANELEALAAAPSEPTAPLSECKNPDCPIGCPDSHTLTFDPDVASPPQDVEREVATARGVEERIAEALMAQNMLDMSCLVAVPVIKSVLEEEVGEGLREAREAYGLAVRRCVDFLQRQADENFMPNEPTQVLIKGLAMAMRAALAAPAPSSINPDTPEFRAGDGYGMSRVFQQLEQYLETGTCECEQVIEFAVKLEGKFRAPKPSPPADQPTELKLRMFIWQGHGHEGIYGDDGEMQCGECRCDYLRDPLSECVEKARVAALQAGLAALRRAAERGQT